MRVLGLAFPYRQDGPSKSCQCLFGSSVPSDGCCEFRSPEFGTGFWGAAVLTSLMAMPETAVDKDGQLVTRENQVRPAREILAVEPKAKPEPMGDATDCEFGCRITRTDSRHDLASALGINRVHFTFNPKESPDLASDDHSMPSR